MKGNLTHFSLSYVWTKDDIGELQKRLKNNLKSLKLIMRAMGWGVVSVTICYIRNYPKI